MNKLIIYIYILLIFFLSASRCLGTYSYVSESVMDIHAFPDPGSEVTTQAVYASPVQVLETDNDWALVEAGDSCRGWCRKKQLIERDLPYPLRNHAEIMTMWTYLYAVNDTAPHPPLASIPFNAQVEVAERVNERWIKFLLLDDTIAWAHRPDFRFDLTPLSIDEMIEKGKQFLGLPYRWGGKSGYGFDCSGFVQTLYSLCGILLPRDAGPQSQFVDEVPIDEVMRGDLIFFRINGCNHVGIAIGQGQFLHSDVPHQGLPGCVRIDRLDDAWWLSKVVSAGRVPSAEPIAPF